MRRQLRSEQLRIVTTSLWWVLLIPAVAVALVVGFSGAAIAGLPDLAQDSGSAPAVALSLPTALELATLFAVALGIVGGAGEFHHRTITTTWLTAPSRTTVLTARSIAHAGLGLLYGVITALACLAGALLRSGVDTFPPARDTLVIAAAGMVGVALWCVLGVGLGALAGNQVAAQVLTLVYLLIGERLLAVLLGLVGSPAADLARYLPGFSSSALQTDHGLTVFAAAFGEQAQVTHEIAEALVGSADQLPWWGGGLLLAAYTVAVGTAAGLRCHRRDIT